MGAADFVKSIMGQPDDFDIFYSMADTDMNAIRAALENAILPLIGPNLSFNSIYDAIQKLRVLCTPDKRSSLRAYSWVAMLIVEIDFNAEKVAKQFKSNSVNWRENRACLQAYHSTCPEYLAARLVSDLCRRAGFFTGRRLIEISIGRIALKEFRKDCGWMGTVENGDLHHVVDWIKSSIQNDAEWLKNVDDQGRPRKIMKAGTLEALCREADKQMRRKLNIAQGAKLGPNDVETFSEDGGDFYLVQLKTSAALRVESVAMRHCVGHGAYDEHLNTDDYYLLSLRDKLGRPHMTIEIRDGQILQSRGKANSTPKPLYKEETARLLARRNLPNMGKQASIPECFAPFDGR
jgi:hypothetical protein